MLDGADMVKFAKNGSDVTTAAVKLARAYTGRDLVAICGDHPFFSVDDWFIGTTELNAGIPEAITRMTLKFQLQRSRQSAAARSTSIPERLLASYSNRKIWFLPLLDISRN